MLLLVNINGGQLSLFRFLHGPHQWANRSMDRGGGGLVGSTRQERPPPLVRTTLHFQNLTKTTPTDVSIACALDEDISNKTITTAPFSAKKAVGSTRGKPHRDLRWQQIYWTHAILVLGPFRARCPCENNGKIPKFDGNNTYCCSALSAASRRHKQ